MYQMILLIKTITQFIELLKPIDVLGDSYTEYNEDFNKKDPKFKVGNHVRISKYKNIFAKEFTPNTSGEFLLLVKLKMQFCGHT